MEGKLSISRLIYAGDAVLLAGKEMDLERLVELVGNFAKRYVRALCSKV